MVETGAENMSRNSCKGLKTIPFVIDGAPGIFNPCPHVRRTKPNEFNGAYACLLKASKRSLVPGDSYSYHYSDDYNVNNQD